MNKLEVDKYCDENNIFKVKSFLENKGDINQRIQQFSGSTLLYSAVVSKHNDNNMEMIRLLLENKANVNLGQYQNQTPLHAAITENKFSIVKALTEHKADILINEKYKSNSIIHCISLQRYDILDYLISTQLKKTKTLFTDTFQVFDIDKQFSLEEWCQFKNYKQCLSIISEYKDFMKNGKKYNMMVNTLEPILYINIMDIIQYYIIGDIQ